MDFYLQAITAPTMVLNAITMAAIFVDGVEIRATDLAPEVCTAVEEESPTAALRIDNAEQELVFKALRQTGGRQDRAAELLGISRRTLIRRMKSYNQRGLSFAAAGFAMPAGIAQ